ncbi:hypothetical protein FPQ18DRAFT_270003 [Pyronema domesticum]|nr:hypothetical protein FPQ18DRAFT_270003 [Pyronema domesticum]
MDDNFDSVQWPVEDEDFPIDYAHPGSNGIASSSEPVQAGLNADALDLAGVGKGVLETTVSSPQTESNGTKDAYVSYLVTTETDFPVFQKPHVEVRRRFTDFVYLWTVLSKEYVAVAVPPLPDKHNMAYVRGDRFGAEFTQRRAHSLHRFLKRISLHPVLRRATTLTIFLESPDWNSHMRHRPTRGSTSSQTESGGVFDSLSDTFLNAFSKVHKPDRRFTDTRDRADKLDEDLSHIERIVARVVRKEADLETDYADLSKEFQKIVELEPELEPSITSFSTGIRKTSEGLKTLKEHTDQDYLSSLRDMGNYIVSLKQLLKTRDQKQLDYEGLTDYLSRAQMEWDQISNAPVGSTGLGGPAGFLRSKLEDARGVDHEASRQERVTKLGHRIDALVREVEDARKLAQCFDDEVVTEVANFERIKCVEMRDTLGGLAKANVEFYKGIANTWEQVLKELGEEEEA